MSLINDALKRAKQAQRQEETGEPHSLHLMPAGPHEKVVRGVGLVVPGVLTFLALLALLLVWIVYQGQRQAATNGGDPNGTTILARAKSPAPATQPSPIETQPAPPPVPVPTPLPVTVPAAGPDTPAQTNETPVIATKPVPPPAITNPAPTLKLNSVMLHPTQPSAMINGRFMRVGDRIVDFRLVAVTAETAILVNARGTNVLRLSD